MSNKFNIKQFIKVSAVALALIGGGAILNNTTGNNNAHADDVVDGFDYTAAIKGAAKSTAREDKLDKISDAKRIAEDEPNRKAEALSDMRQGFYVDADLVNDPVVRNYLKSKGYSDAQINNDIDTPEKDKKLDNDVENYVDNISKDALKYATSNVINHHIKRNRSSRSTPKITTDAQAIKNDRKQLSTRKAKRAMNNYKHNHKSNRYVKHLIQTNKDLTKHQNHLARTKSNRKARTKRNRKSSKRVRKTNRKNKNAKRTRRNKRNHKRINKRNRKHMKRANHKHTHIRRNQRNRK